MGTHALSSQGYIDQVESNARRLVEVARGMPLDGRVPTYPAYVVGTLAVHVAAGLQRMAAILETAKLPALGEPTAPGPGDAAFALVEAALTAFLEVAERTDPAKPVEHFMPSAPQTAAFVLRAAATEVAIHRWDMESVTGRHQPIATELALDLVDALFDVWVPARLGSGPPCELGGTVGLEASDTGDRWLVQAADGRVSGTMVDGLVDATAWLAAPASDLLLVLWKRLDKRSPAVVRRGDGAVIDRLLDLDYVPDPMTSSAR